MKFIEEPKEILGIFSRIVDSVARETAAAVHRVEADRFHVNLQLTEKYKLVLFEHERDLEFQIRLEPASRSAFLVEFGFGKNRRSKLATDNGEIYLLREAVSLSGGYRPNFDLLKISGKYYYVVCVLGDSISAEIIRFYEDATKHDFIPPDKWTADYGSEKEYFRAGCLIIPKHHPIAKKAEEYLRRNEYDLLLAQGCRPDFFVRKNGRTAVVEVKPDLKQQSIATAIGQLLLYKQITACDDMLMILPHDEEFEAVVAQLANVDPRLKLISVPR